MASSAKKPAAVPAAQDSFDPSALEEWGGGQRDQLIRIPPLSYIYVLDVNTNVTEVHTGPKTLTCLDHQRIIGQPWKMMVVPQNHYCVIANPVVREADGTVARDSVKQIKLRHGEFEVRFEQDPFPLYPGERAVQVPKPLPVIERSTGLLLRAKVDFQEEDGTKRTAGDEFLLEGPLVYRPRVEVEELGTVRALKTKKHQALHFRAKRECVDRSGSHRHAGQEYLVRLSDGEYLPTAHEEFVKVVDGTVLTENVALHLRARASFSDAYNVLRKAGQEWLVTSEMAEVHICDVFEDVVAMVSRTIVTPRQFVVLVNPVDENGKPQLGKRVLVHNRNETVSFFVQPGEALETAVQDTFILEANEALVLKAREQIPPPQRGGQWQLRMFGAVLSPLVATLLGLSTLLFLPPHIAAATSLAIFGAALDRSASTGHAAGARWLHYGPADFVPPLAVDVVERRRALLTFESFGVSAFFWTKVGLRR